MVTLEEAREMALSFDGAGEEPHFEKTSFRIRKKIFATMDLKSGKMVLKLTEMDQSLFCSFDKQVMYPVPNKWGKQGWTQVVLDTVPKETLKDALEAAYQTVKGK